MVFLLASSCGTKEVAIPSDSSVKFYAQIGTELRMDAEPRREGGFIYYGSADEDAFVFVVNEQGQELWFTRVEGEYYDDFAGAI